MAKRYTILNQRQSEDLTPAGVFVPVMDITFETADGHIGNIKVPLRDYNVDNVQQLLEEQVATMGAVHQLGD